MNNSSRRQQLWQRIEAGEHWDMLVIGGGIVGAAVLREAARAGLKVLLLEQRDYSWGTSSRSSKMVHGGLRYIATGDFSITRDSVREREKLMQQAPGLVEPLRYLFADRVGKLPGRWLFTAVLLIYDLFARKLDHRFLHRQDTEMQAPHWSTEGLNGACQYTDAATDDARLVLRVLQEAMAEGGEALNYCSVEQLVQSQGNVSGVVARLEGSASTLEINAKVVVNATGAWADKLREQVGGESRVRPLRGSHLVFPSWRLPVYQSLTLMHPRDKRPVFIFPWEGVTVVGTTDVDHQQDMDEEPSIRADELVYLFEVLDSEFPRMGLTVADVVSSYSGIRPVIGTGALNPSAEKRDHEVWDESGMLTVTGGKLTTFRLIAADVLAAAAEHLPELQLSENDSPAFSHVAEPEAWLPALGADQRRRLLGRYGADIIALAEAAPAEQLQLIPGTQTLWLELAWAAASEQVQHLDDLLLRRTRIGLLVPNGALAYMPRIRELCQSALTWDAEHWAREIVRYKKIWQSCYSLPDQEVAHSATG